MPKRLLIFLLLLSTVVFAGTIWRGVYIKQTGTATGGSPPPPPPPVDSIGAEWWTGDPIGGGVGYSDIIDYTTLSNNHTSSWIIGAGGTPKDSLAQFLANAGAGDTIYIMDYVSIDLTNTVHTTYTVPAGCILASGRGATMGDTTSWGALIYINRKYADEWEVLAVGGKQARITGLRIFGSYYEYENGLPTSDSFNYSVKAEYGVRFMADSTELDNCELSGWGSAPIYMVSNIDSVFVHHNHIVGSRVIPGYGQTFGHLNGGSGSARLWANWYDRNYGTLFMWGGGYCQNLEGIAHHNIIGRHETIQCVRFHGGLEGTVVASLQAYNNTFMNNIYGEGSRRVATADNPRTAPDTVRFYNNWCWAADSATSWELHGIDKVKIYDNSYGTTPPDGLAGRIPTAVIWSDVDSGNVPLTVKFKTTGSSDPDGTLEVAYWDFGDSLQLDNYDRYDNIANDSATHTYNQVGEYQIELMVRDEYGCQGYAYKTIKAKPTDGKNYLSCWIKDWYNDKSTGYVYAQIYLDNWKCWEKDMAGAGSWQHIVIDVTDTLAIKDSVTVKFQMYVAKDSSDCPKAAYVYVDDVSLNGATVLNGNFENISWSANEYGRDGGGWDGTEYSPSTSAYYATNQGGDVHGGRVAYELGRRGGAIKAGDYASVSQRVNVE